MRDDGQPMTAAFSNVIVLLPLVYLVLSIAAILSRKNSLLKSLASHGKTRQMSSWSLVDFEVPKQFFTHFYIVGQCSAIGIFYLAGEVPFLSTSQWLLFIHLCRRTYECWYVHRFLSQSKMHFLGYLLGIGHYTILPLVFVGRTSQSVPLTIHALCCAVNLWLQYEQYMHHKILAALRPFDHQQHSEAYRIPPRHRWFQWSLSPHYLAEILLYASWAVMLSFQPARPLDWSWSGAFSAPLMRRIDLFARQRQWFLFFWVMTNLSVSALNNRDWYSKKRPELSR